MALDSLRKKIESSEVRLAVIGLGYVGLPVACQFARIGFDVLGVDIHIDRINLINQGVSPIDGNEPGLSDLISEVRATGKLRASADYQELSDRDVILITVETPVDENNVPHYEALSTALSSLGKVMKRGALVIVESTISPGTMQHLALPVLEESSGLCINYDFYLGHCPERVMPGKLLANLRNVSRVVGGMTPETSDIMVALYRHIVKADLDPSDCITAELVKTTENTYRDVQIAFANEVALICEAVGGDVWRVRQLVNKSPYRQMHLPGAGVGGHCIPKDPWLLVHSTTKKNIPTRLIPVARQINDSMPRHMYRLIVKALRKFDLEISDSRILVMGYTYNADSDDPRNSPSATLVDILRTNGADTVIHEPFMDVYKGNVFDFARGCDAAVLMVAHNVYKGVNLEHLKEALKTPVLVDGRNLFDVGAAKQAGFLYLCVGQAQLS